MPRINKGRQRIEMVKMKNENNLQVTFSKRRAGLFKKASELCTLCGVELAIIVSSPGGKVFSFGNPSVETVANRFLSPNPMACQHHQGTDYFMETRRNQMIHELNMYLTQITKQLEMEKMRGEELGRLRQENNWWESPVEEMNGEQLDQLSSALKGLKQKVGEQMQKLMMLKRLPPRPFYVGNPSGGAEVPSSLLQDQPNQNSFDGITTASTTTSLGRFFPQA